ncbi:MAG: hypothetical protein HY236_10570 [Acidobacteria bacterium]|nr:hypothetical protein [Acidobacteriota bacterium]
MNWTRREFMLTAAVAPAWLEGQTQPKPRLRRKDSFFGIHLDLHPNKDDPALGRDVTEEMVERFLARVKPDYVQYDCKGHVGYLGYPSKVSTSAPIVHDSLAVWRRVTARHGVALYIHFSGVWDSLAVEQHPEWARVRPEGEKEDRQTSTFGPYVDERMIPQLKEAAEKYDLDGAWVDGECWATNPDYGERVREAFRRETGVDQLPRGPQDHGWLEFLELNRRQFRVYVRHYVEALHAFRPGFQIASNWLYSTFVPERPELPVDFVSGDYLGNASISTARLEARYLSAIDKPWDLMAWGFQSGNSNQVGEIHKPAAQLMQEAAVVLAEGGGFQIYYQPTRAGRIDDRHIAVMERVAEFCRARQKICHQSEAVPQIGLLFSGHTLYTKSPKLFGGWGAAVNPARGLLDALVENHYSVDVIPDWKLAEAAGRYPMIAVPDWSNIGEEARRTLVDYVRSGGRMLLAGADNAALFADMLGVRLAGKPEDQPAFVPGVEVFANLRGVWQEVEPTGAQAIEQRYPTYDSTRDGRCAATVSDYGKGRIAAIYGPVGSVFAATHAPEVRHLVSRAVSRIFEPMVQLEGPPTMEVVLRKKEGKLMLHLVNTAGMQVAGDYSAVDFIPPVGPLRVSLRLPQRPARVTLEPEGRVLDGTSKDGAWSARVDRLEIESTLACTL